MLAVSTLASQCIEEWLLESSAVDSTNFFDKNTAEAKRAAKRPARDCPLCKAYPLNEALLNAPLEPTTDP